MAANIYLFKNGKCKAEEFIEGNYYEFNKDGTVHYIQFIEGDYALHLNKTGFYAEEFLEHEIAYLTDELDVKLIDENENYLTTII